MNASEQTGGYDLPTFPYRRPPELDGPGPRHPVAIVGGGLAGLTLACDLATRGVACVLLDEDDTVGVRGASSRGICYARKSLEIFDRLGIYPRIAAKGVTWSVGRVHGDTDELYAFDLARGALSHQPPFINLQQFYIEWFLVDRLAELPLADIRWRQQVTAIEPHDDHVVLRVATPDGDYALDAAWVVDASGSGGRLRGLLNLPATSSPGEDRWCISDVRFAADLPDQRWTWVAASFNEGRAVWQHPMADGVWRIDYQMAPDCDPAVISRPETVRARLAAHLGAETAVELVWVGPYGYRATMMDRFRHGRVLFAGDVAHVMSPFGARGGNSGIQDAENLGWKLAAVLAGEAPETLIDSYDAERRAAAAENIRVTARTARFLAPRSRFERGLRQAVLDLARRHPFARALVNTGRMSIASDYAASPLSSAGGGAALPNVALTHADGRPGVLTDLLRGAGAPFLVLAFPGTDLPEACVVGRDVAGPDLAALGAAGEVLVVRPDLHLAARLMRPTAAEVRAAIDRALGRETA